MRFCNRVIIVAALLVGSTSLAAEPTKLASAVQPFVDRHELAGAVMLIASKDKVIDLETVGYADVTASKSIPVDALFWIASMSKPITATAVMMLVDEGKVRLDDPVEKYLPEFKPRIMQANEKKRRVELRPPEHPITVRQLLSHQSGLVARSSLETPTLDRFPLTLGVQSYSLEPLMFEPGSNTQYSNAGFNTAARIVEVVSALPFEQFLQQRLFDPLHMTDTTFWPSAAQLERLAKYYTADSTGLKEETLEQLSYPLTDRAHRFPMPAGGLFSTANDILRFAEIYLNEGTVDGKRYLSPAAIAEMTHNLGKAAIVNYDGYGLGWGTRPSGVYGHTSGSASSVTIDPLRGLIMIWMVQIGGLAGYEGQTTFEKTALRHYSSSSLN